MNESTKTTKTTENASESQNRFNLAELLKLADTQAETQGERKANTCRLYASGRINFASGSGIKAGINYTAKIADSTLILYADKNAKRKANKKTDSADILFNLSADLRNRDSYSQAVENSKTDGNKTFKDYSITTETLNETDYFIIDLNEHASETESTETDSTETESQE